MFHRNMANEYVFFITPTNSCIFIGIVPATNTD